MPVPSCPDAAGAGARERHSGIRRHAALLDDLRAFVRQEQQAARAQLNERWSQPVARKLQTGWSQRFRRLEWAVEPGDAVWAYLDAGDARFRVGDMLLLHSGNPWDGLLARQVVLEVEQDHRWLLRGLRLKSMMAAYDGGPCYADPDILDLTEFFQRALDELAASQIGREVVLPLLCGALEPGFVPDEVDEGARRADSQRGFNARQAQAVGLAFGAEQMACIQGPPGTGKSAVLAFAARLMVERGERVLVTSHTHMAINNALNKVQAQGVPVVKIGRLSQRKGLDAAVESHEVVADWESRPADGGYVIGATPFATCTSRLEGCEFDTVIFDEASQVTVPLALMAMRKGRRFVFIGDARQLPPVLLSRSVLDERAMSVFAVLLSQHGDHCVMLEETYRMNAALTAWPSRRYYGGRLRAAAAVRERGLRLAGELPGWCAALLAPAPAAVFVPTLDPHGRSRSPRDAELVAALCAAAVAGGLAPREIGIVTPYRAQGRAIRARLRQRLGKAAARDVVADTVERMQGQERELVILSLASGDPAFLGGVAEFFFQPQRLNVSITRARSKLVVIGPALDAAPEVEHPLLKQWIGQYVDLLQHLARVELPGAPDA